ncbi:MAG: hypothetical protein Q7S32_01345 [bacterium]|nr:hypothetical protein [bacterium]
MSVGPPLGIVRQKWEDIQNYQVNAVCDLCKSQEKVKMGEIPSTACAMTRRIVTGWTYWYLCEKCHSQGWIPDGESFQSRITYWNFKVEPIQIRTV